MKRDLEHAREYLAKAVERDANDPLVLYYSAMFFQQESGSRPGDRVENAVVIQKRLEKAVELNPECADAYSLLGFAFLRQGKQNEACRR